MNNKFLLNLKIQKFILEISVFISGAVIMIFELIGSRVLAPYIGTSIFVWTSIIGIILGSLSLGYFLGGKLADKKATIINFSIIIFSAAFFIFITNIIKDPLLTFLQTSNLNIKNSSIISSFILFLPASVFLGMVSPYAIKLKIKDLEKSGSVVGNLYAISTTGSIIGTFLAGFYLIPNFGTTKLLFILPGILIFVSFILIIKYFKKKKYLFITSFIFIFFIFNLFYLIQKTNDFLDFDTSYSRVWIRDNIDPYTKKPVKEMLINKEHNSAMFLYDNSLVYEYSKYYDLANHFNPNFKKSLMIGGGAYSYPKYYLDKYPEAKIDVVEIDPKVTELAKKYFKLKDNPRLTVFHEDGRTFLNKTKNKYDVILGDSFKSFYSLPYQLTTQEAIRRKYEILNEKGVVIVNLISSIDGEKSDFLKAEYATYKSIFPQVYIFPIQTLDENVVQSIVLVAIKSDIPVSFKSDYIKTAIQLNHLWTKEIILDKPILTDDFAPVDYYINKML